MKEVRMTNDSKSTLQGNKTDQDQDQLRDDQLEAVSAGGVVGFFQTIGGAISGGGGENSEQLKALETFGKALQKAGQI
jgi:hypothetical protein